MNETAQLHQNDNNVLFESHYKNVWRKLIPPGLTEAEVDFIQDVAKLNAGSKVLDIMCGYGRHTLELGRRGYSVKAIDNLKDYIDEIEGKKTAENLSITTARMDVGKEDFADVFDAVICMGNSFASFDEPRVKHVLANVAASLQPGGVFIINSWMIAEIAIKHFEHKTWLYVDEYKYLLDNKFLFNPTRIETDHILITPGGSTEVLKGVDYIITFAELEKMLSKAGMRLKDIYSTPRKRKYSFGDNRAYIVAEKI